MRLTVQRAALLLRASEAAAVLEHVADARAFLEQAANEDPGDVPIDTPNNDTPTFSLAGLSIQEVMALPGVQDVACATTLPQGRSYQGS